MAIVSIQSVIDTIMSVIMPEWLQYELAGEIVLEAAEYVANSY